ncbi:MAG: hypothetical protein KUL76_05405, partial [Kaistella sp.]|nr:hypothetical protein [Kaistella sp.]
PSPCSLPGLSGSKTSTHLFILKNSEFIIHRSFFNSDASLFHLVTPEYKRSYMSFFEKLPGKNFNLTSVFKKMNVKE